MTEIHLILAGVELGPYSEEQVRRYLAEGLARPSDRARLVNDAEWSPLEELLAHLPPPPSKPTPVADLIDDWELTFEPTPIPTVELFPEPEPEEPPAPILEPEPVPEPELELPSEPPPTATGSLRAIRSTRNVAKARKRIIGPSPKAPTHALLTNWQRPPVPPPATAVKPLPDVVPPTPEPVPEPPSTPPSELAQEEPPPVETPEAIVEAAAPPVEVPEPEPPPPKKNALLSRITQSLLPRRPVAPEAVVVQAKSVPDVAPPTSEPIPIPEAPPTLPPEIAKEEPSEVIAEEPPSKVDSPTPDLPPKQKTALLPRTASQSLQPKGPVPPTAPVTTAKAIKITGRAPLSVTGVARRKLQREEPRKGATVALEALRAATPTSKVELKPGEPATPTAPPPQSRPPSISATRTKLLEALKKEPEAPPQKVEPKVEEPVAPPTPIEKPMEVRPSITGTIAKLLETSKIDIARKSGKLVPQKVEPKVEEPVTSQTSAPAPSATTEVKASTEQLVKAPPLAARPLGKLSDVARKPPEAEATTPLAAEIKSTGSVAAPAPEKETPAVKPKPKTERLVFVGEEPLVEEKPAKTGILAAAKATGKLAAKTAPLAKISPPPAEESKVELKPFSYTKTGRQPLVPRRRINPLLYVAIGAAALVLMVAFFLIYLGSSAFMKTFGAHAPTSAVVQHETPEVTSTSPEPQVRSSSDNGPRTSGDFYKRGLERQGKGDLDGALADFNQALVIDPQNAGAYSYRGFVEQAKGDVDTAVLDYSRSLEINPKNAVAFYNRGLIKSQHGDLDGAIEDFNKALEVNPKIAVAYYNRGLVKNQKNDLDGAITDFSQALDFDPKLAGAFYNRGLANQAKGDLEPALNDYNQALGLDPNIAVAYYYRGLIKEQQSDLDGAIVDYDQALVLDPKNYEAYYNRGLAKQAKGDLDGSLKDLEKFCDSAPLSPYADYGRLYIWLVNSLQHEGKYADEQLSESLRKQWNSSSSDFVTKVAAFLVGTMNEPDFLASAASPDQKKDQGQHCEAWYFAGMKRLMAKDRDTAIDYLNKCVATEERDYCEYISAQAELKRLQAVK